ncbi:MAG: argininosuccinate synthase [Calditrichia bacterium]
MSKPKVILAYSGGLDTSVILKWLANKGYEVICFVGNIGQTEDFCAAVGEKALATGATKVYVEDLREEFVTKYIFPALRGNAIYEGRYLLGTYRWRDPVWLNARSKSLKKKAPDLLLTA